MKPARMISLHAAAPEKPAIGAPCNGCGVCCALETCPAARLLFLQQRGPCPALAWDEAVQRYHCGLMLHPETHIGWLPGMLRTAAQRWAARAIAAGIGCDCEASVSDE